MIRKIAMTAFAVPVLGALVGLSFPNAAPKPVLPLNETLRAPENVRPIIARACRDCHSNETRWPWYSHVPPVSFLIQRDVKEGRAHVNFSTWTQAKPPTLNQVREVCDAVSDGTMPPKPYRLMHPEARLSDQEVDVLCNWASLLGK